MTETTFELGPIRPTSEAASLLLRVTRGCPWNQCKFCNNYRNMDFSPRSAQELKADIDVMAGYYECVMAHYDGEAFDMEGVNAEYAALQTPQERQCYGMLFNWISAGEYSVFLQDADAMAMPADLLAETLRHLRTRLPMTGRITSYGRADTLARITPEDYQALREAGLSRIHAGFETGHDEVLRRILKGVTSQEEIEGGRRVMESGVELSVFLMAGIGGRALSDANADATAQVINAVNPSFVRLRTAVVIEGTPLWQDLQSGVFDECTDMEQLLEMRRFLAGIRGCDGIVFSDHMVNLLQELQGPLTDTQALIGYIDAFLALPQEERRKYQLAKRLGFNGTWKQMHILNEKDRNAIEHACATIPEGPHWEKLMKDRLRQYI